MLKLDRIEHSVTLLRHRALAQDAMQRNVHVEKQRSIGEQDAEKHPENTLVSQGAITG